MYEYQCKKCGHRFEKIEKFSARPEKKCPKCKKGPVERMISSPAIQFKGTGWYVTDYAGKTGAPPAEESKPVGEAATPAQEKPKEKESNEKKKGKKKD